MARRMLVVDSGGTTRLIKTGRLFVVDSGSTTRQIKRLFVVDSGGTARQVYQSFTPNLPPNSTVIISDSSTIGDTETAQIVIGTNGVLAYVNNDGPSNVDWGSPTGAGNGTGFYVRITVSSGSNPSEGTQGTWISTNSDVTWSWSVAHPGTLTSSGTIEVASDSGGTDILDSTDYSVSLNTEA